MRSVDEKSSDDRRALRLARYERPVRMLTAVLMVLLFVAALALTNIEHR